MQNCLKFRRLTICVIVMSAYLSVISCNNGNAEAAKQLVAGYDLNKPFLIKLPPVLDEISGVSYYEKDKSVFGIVDENGVLFKISLNEEPTVEQWKFDTKGDYEDIVRVDSTFYTLLSKGKIVRFTFKDKAPTAIEEFALDIHGKNEFEILYYDDERKKLIMICKDCENDNKSSASAYAFDPETKTFENNPFSIDVTPIAKALGEQKVKFKPSAAAIHPITKDLFIISSVNKCLVIADRNGAIKKVIRLDPKRYKQPEGICFTPEGHLIITNESADAGAANILVYKYKK
jgi:uncharacterized protein YjiK